ncbi:hypothetical protein K1W54_27800 [Micromonospora sp. CPCC 205371]|nr:hypothetical protein [Micromonospora sp. CPCC 205371]
MPASQPPSERRGARLLTMLFWAGVGLAPLAALLLLLGQGAGALRVAAVLAVLAVVLIGLSITLRRDAESVRLDMEETLLEEVDMLREDVRNDIATAARATHKAFSEKLQMMHESVQALRMQVEAARVAAGGPNSPPAPAHDSAAAQPRAFEGAAFPAAAGFARPEPPAGGNGQPMHAGVAQPTGAASVAEAGRLGIAQPAGTASVPQPAHAGMAMPPAGPGHVGARARVPGGIVRHTETVQVTTRQTIVDPHGDDESGTGRVYGAGAYGGYEGGGYGGPEFPSADEATARPGRYGGDASQWSAPPAPPPGGRRRRAAEPDEQWQDGRRGGGSWQDDRQRGGDQPWSDGRGDAAWQGDRSRGADQSWEDGRRGPDGSWQGDRPRDGSWSGDRARSGGDGRRPRPDGRGDEPRGDGRGTGVKGGDRWASVRSDDRVQELRMGERRAAVRADESGSEVRIQDRWAAVRREEPRREEPRREEPRRDEPHEDGAWLRDLRGVQSDDGWDRRDGPAALPAAPIEPTTSWGQGWNAVERDSAGRRRRYQDDEDEYRYQPDTGRRSRRADEDQRWR